MPPTAKNPARSQATGFGTGQLLGGVGYPENKLSSLELQERFLGSPYGVQRDHALAFPNRRAA